MIKLTMLLAATATPATVLAFVHGGSSFTPTGKQTVEVCTMKASLRIQPAQERMPLCWCSCLVPGSRYGSIIQFTTRKQTGWYYSGVYTWYVVTWYLCSYTVLRTLFTTLVC